MSVVFVDLCRGSVSRRRRSVWRAGARRVALVGVALCAATAGLVVAGGEVSAAVRVMAPARTIVGPSIQIQRPAAVAADGAGNAYVTETFNSVATATNVVRVYGPSQNGDAQPTGSISGISSQLDAPIGVDVDAAGYVYVANYGSNRVTIHAPIGSGGGVAPKQSIVVPGAMGVDATAEALWVSAFINNVSSIYRFDRAEAPTETSLYETAFSLRITAVSNELAAPYDIAVSPSGDVAAVTISPGSVAGAGFVEYSAQSLQNASGTTALPSTRLNVGYLMSATSVDYDPEGNLYVLGTPKTPNGTTGTVVAMYPSQATSTAEPAEILTGAGPTPLDGNAIALTKNHHILITDYSNAKVHDFAPLKAPFGPPEPGPGTPVPPAPTPPSPTPPSGVVTPPASAPTAVTGLKVTGKNNAAKRTVSWKAPAATGGVALARYELLVTAKVKKTVKGKKKTVTKLVYKTQVPAAKLEAVLPKSKLRAGKNTVEVRAVNSAGLSSTSTSKTFTVKTK